MLWLAVLRPMNAYQPPPVLVPEAFSFSSTSTHTDLLLYRSPPATFSVAFDGIDDYLVFTNSYGNAQVYGNSVHDIS